MRFQLLLLNVMLIQKHIDIEDVNEDTFEVDAKHNALVIKSGCMPDPRDWEHSCW